MRNSICLRIPLRKAPDQISYEDLVDMVIADALKGETPEHVTLCKKHCTRT